MKQMNRESGNVLFLILIAVALFAALSYAVTQSTRSGAGSTDREQSLLGSASLTQYPTALRTSVVRMLLAGLDVKDLLFAAPAGFTTISNQHLLVFHPDGGGAVYQQAPVDVMASGGVGTWSHNMNFAIPGIGRTATPATAATADLIAFLPGVNDPSCARVNTQMGVNTTAGGCVPNYYGIPSITISDVNHIRDNQEEEPLPTVIVAPVGGNLNCPNAAETGAFTGKATGCFNGGTGLGNVFYSVIIER